MVENMLGRKGNPKTKELAPSPVPLSFVPRIIYSVPCDRIVQKGIFIEKYNVLSHVNANVHKYWQPLSERILPLANVGKSQVLARI